MRLDLPAVIPAKAAQEMPTRLIHFKLLGRDLYGAFEHVQLRANGKTVEQTGIGTNLACQQGIALTGRVARTHQHAARLCAAQCAHEFAAQRQQGRHVQQQHALACKPDAAITGRKMYLAAQILIGWQGRQESRHTQKYR